MGWATIEVSNRTNPIAPALSNATSAAGGKVRSAVSQMARTAALRQELGLEDEATQGLLLALPDAKRAAAVEGHLDAWKALGLSIDLIDAAEARRREPGLVHDERLAGVPFQLGRLRFGDVVDVAKYAEVGDVQARASGGDADRRGVEPDRNQARVVRDVRRQQRADLVGDRAKARPIDDQRIRRRAGDNHLWLVLLGELFDLAVVDFLVRVQTVTHDVEQLAAEIHR